MTRTMLRQMVLMTYVMQACVILMTAFLIGLLILLERIGTSPWMLMFQAIMTALSSGQGYRQFCRLARERGLLREVIKKQSEVG